MKRTAKTTLAAAAIVAGTVFGAKAQEKSVRLDPVGENLYQLTYIKEGKCNVMVEILNQDGRELYSERIKQKNSFVKPYSFENLEDGAFSFKVTDDQGIYVTTIKRTDEVNMVANIRKIDEEKAKVMVRGEFMAPVSVYIYDRYNALVFDDYIDHEASFSRVYDLSKVKADDLRIEVISESKMLATAEF
jgi:hypothetical protein